MALGSLASASSSAGAGGADLECALPFIFTRCARGDSEVLDAVDTGDIARSGAVSIMGAGVSGRDLGFEGPGVSISTSSSTGWCFSSTTATGRFLFAALFCCSSARRRPLWYSRLELYVTGRGLRCLCQYLPARKLSNVTSSERKIDTHRKYHTATCLPKVLSDGRWRCSPGNRSSSSAKRRR